MIIISNESLLSLNNFGKPKSVNGNEAIYYSLTRLLLLEKGTFQSHPDMGVGIVSRYRYAFEDKFRDLQHDIQEQISKYLPELSGVSVNVGFSNNSFTIEISIDNILYKYNFNTESANLETVRTT